MRYKLLLKEYKIGEYNLLFFLKSFAIFVLLIVLVQNLADNHNKQVTDFYPYVKIQCTSLRNLLDHLNNKSVYYIDELVL